MRTRPLVAALLLVPLVVLGLPSATGAADATTTWWHPGPLSSWAYVIGENYPLAVPTNIGGVQVYDSDAGIEGGLSASGMPVASPAIESSVAAVHAAGAHAICYLDVGGAENYRSDFSLFDPSELGSPEPGWPDEQWVNVADWSMAVPAPYETLQTIMTNRIDLCREEGFDAVEPDNDDAYANAPLGGFTLTMGQDETYLEELAGIAHADGLAIFLKNGINGDSFVSDVAPYVDGAVNEQCWQYSECSALEPFVSAGKPVLNVEYANEAEATVCPEAAAFPMATIHTDVNLDGDIAWGCWQYGGGAATTTTAVTTTSTTAATTTTTKATTTTTAATTTTTKATTTTTKATTTTTKATTTTAAPATTATTAPPSGASPPPATTTPPATTSPGTTTSTTTPRTTSSAPQTTTTRPQTTTTRPRTTTTKPRTTTTKRQTTTTGKGSSHHRHRQSARVPKVRKPTPTPVHHPKKKHKPAG